MGRTVYDSRPTVPVGASRPLPYPTLQMPRRENSFRNRRWLSHLVLIAPLLVGLSLVYILPFFGVAAWSVTLPAVGLGQY